MSYFKSLKTILSDCAKALVETKRRNDRRNFVENLIMLIVLKWLKSN
jgi:hypothetical protein